MKTGDKILVEAEVALVGQGWVMVRFPKVGHHPPANVRVPADQIRTGRKKAP
jgi:hypothetical protein